MPYICLASLKMCICILVLCICMHACSCKSDCIVKASFIVLVLLYGCVIGNFYCIVAKGLSLCN